MSSHKCAYCGQEARYQMKNGKWCCQPNYQSCPINREKRKNTIQKRWDTLKEMGFKTQLKEELGDTRTLLNTSRSTENFTKKEIEERAKQLEEHPELCLCSGCGRPAKYMLKSGVYYCESHPSKCPGNRKKNSEGLKKSYVEGKKRDGEWNGSEKNLRVLKEATDRRVQRQMEEAFVEHSRASNAAINNYLQNYLHWELRCSKCGLTEWQGEKIPLELHHINGNNSDNRLENLTYLCPNCHATTENFRGKNINNGKQRVTDEELVESLKSSESVRQALTKVGLTPKGGNYIRAYKLLSQLA